MATKAQSGKVSRKKRYVEKPDIRTDLLNAAEALIREEGYAAATARRVADRVGMKHPSIFYYFENQDGLLVEVFRRVAKLQRERLEAALDSDNPISAMREFHRDPEVTKFLLEFMALANHNDTIRAEIARNTEDLRRLEIAAIERHTKMRGIEPQLPPLVVSILTSAAARLLVQEANLGITLGHAEFQTMDEASFERFEKRGDASPGVAAIVGALSADQPAESQE